MMFLYAGGAEQNVSKARTRFGKAASQNQPDALYQPGVMYYRGKGVALMKASCDNGKPEACPWVRNLTENKDKFRQIFSGKPSSGQPPR